MMSWVEILFLTLAVLKYAGRIVWKASKFQLTHLIVPGAKLLSSPSLTAFYLAPFHAPGVNIKTPERYLSGLASPGPYRTPALASRVPNPVDECSSIFEYSAVSFRRPSANHHIRHTHTHVH